MVRAILEGRKTQTRRIIKNQPVDAGGGSIDHYGPDAMAAIARQCKYGQPGDRLWVRETWAYAKRSTDSTIFYRATDKDIKQRALDYSERENRWRPSIHMPKAISRITLEIINVRVERLQDIREADAVAEGIEPSEGCHIAEEAFMELWQSINGLDSWDANPWVWVIVFKKT